MASTTRPIKFNRYGHEVSTHCGQNNPYGCGAPLDAPDGHCTNVAFHAARFFKTRDEGETPMTGQISERYEVRRSDSHGGFIIYDGEADDYVSHPVLTSRICTWPTRSAADEFVRDHCQDAKPLRAGTQKRTAR